MGFFDAIQDAGNYLVRGGPLGQALGFQGGQQPNQPQVTTGFQAVMPEHYKNNDNAYSGSEAQQDQVDPLDQPFRSNAGGFTYPQDDTPAMQKVRGYFQEPSGNELGGALDFNTAPKGNNAVNIEQEESIPVAPSRPQVNSALSGLPAALKGETSEAIPPQRSGIATGDKRDQILRMAGLATDSDRSVADSKFRQSQKTTEVGGRMLPNPQEPGLDPVERARRYEAIVAADPNSEKGKFARNELFQISKDPVQAAALKNAVSGERMTNAADVAAANVTREQGNIDREFGLKQKTADIENAGKSLDNLLKSGTLDANTQKAIQDVQKLIAETKKTGAETIKTGEETKKTIAETGKTGVETEKAKAETGKLGEEVKQLKAKPFVETAKEFGQQFDTIVKDADDQYNKALESQSKDPFSASSSNIKAKAETARAQKIGNVINQAISLGKAQGLSDEQIQQLVRRTVPNLQGYPASTLKQITNVGGDVSRIIGNVRGATQVMSGI